MMRSNELRIGFSAPSKVLGGLGGQADSSLGIEAVVSTENWPPAEKKGKLFFASSRAVCGSRAGRLPSQVLRAVRLFSGDFMAKWIKRIVLVVVLLAVVGIVIVYFSLNSIVRATVQSQATASLGVKTTLGSAALSIFGGSLQLNNLDVSSPPNFSAPDLFTLAAIKMGVSYGQLRNQPIHASEIVITNPDLVLEQANGKLNLQALKDQMPTTPASAAPASSGQPAEPMKLIIDHLELQNANVTIRAGIPGLSSPISVTVPSLVMTNIGNADGAGNGAAMKDVIMQVATSLSARGVDTANLPPEVKALLAGGINGLSAQLNTELHTQIESLSGSLDKSLNKSLGNSLGGGNLNGLLGGGGNGKSGPTTQSLEQGLGNLLNQKK
jgi:hypothetical protein